ncbi:YncE family protein [Gordonia sp. NPDC003429]
MPAPRLSRSARHRPRGHRLLASSAVVACAVVVVAGCGSSNDNTGDIPTVPAATASPAPHGPPATPAGTVIPTPPGSTQLALSSDLLAVPSADGTSLLRIRTGAPADPLPTVTTPHLTTVIGVGGGTFLGAGPRVLVRIDPDGSTHPTTTAVTDPTALARTPSGQTLVGTGNGHVLVFDNAFKQVRDIGGFVRVDEITVSPTTADLPSQQVVVLDRAQSSVTPVTLGDGDLGPALRAGNGAAEATVDRYGRVLVSNPRDNEILGFFGSPLVMRFRYPVPDGPFAVDYDDTHNLLWVSTTANNEVMAYDLAGGEPVEKHRFASVAQPDAIAVDDTSGTVFVLSARVGGVQVITPGTPAAPSTTPTGG